MIDNSKKLSFEEVQSIAEAVVTRLVEAYEAKRLEDMRKQVMGYVNVGRLSMNEARERMEKR